MVTRRTLYSDFLTTWAERLKNEGLITDAIKQSIESNLESDSFAEAIDVIKTVATDDLSKLILRKLKETQSIEELLDETIPTTMTFDSHEVEQHREYCYKEFVFSSTNSDLYVITSLKLEKSIAVHDMSEDEWKVLEMMLLRDVASMDFIDTLTNDLSHGKKIVYVLTSIANPDVWRLYSYAYLCHINIGSVDIPVELEYEPSAHHFTTPPISFNPDVLYEQYFEAYHVMNESKHVKDILSRYLRMYQVLEQFVYRYKLVEIVKANDKNSAFVRNVIKYANKSFKEERDQFVDGFKKIFPTIDAIIKKVDIDPYNNFLESVYLIKSGDPHVPAKVAKIIYALRCSIVHNKESELHFTFGNIDEYREGIGLMKEILPKMEAQIVNTINTPGCLVAYTKEVMALY